MHLQELVFSATFFGFTSVFQNVPFLRRVRKFLVTVPAGLSCFRNFALSRFLSSAACPYPRH
jgi:hypothetical protein